MSETTKTFQNKTKFSKNWQKLKAKIAKLHHKISNIRKNYLHQISSQISQTTRLCTLKICK
ncbi:transposase [Kingella negevensis]|uniref:transposase n=1 Tax=Kingella negevensis TaxID=1522312 RepID=UPI00254AD6ED|nr:transposase [Kingella negevensis]MDK4707909.1 transposase [Kingella negevensis]